MIYCVACSPLVNSVYLLVHLTLLSPPTAPGLADLSRDIHSPEPELLYYRVSEDQDVLLNQTQGNPEERTALSSDIAGAPAWYKTHSGIPFIHANVTDEKYHYTFVILSLKILLCHRPLCCPV